MKEIENKLFFTCLSEEIAEGKAVILRVKGRSMLPFLRETDIITLIPVDKDNLKVGDIVLFRYRKKYFLHRIIRKKNENIVLQGDAIKEHFERTTTKWVIAILQKVQRKNGKIINCQSFWWRIGFYLWFCVKIVHYGFIRIFKK